MFVRVTTVGKLVFDYEEVSDVQGEDDSIIIQFASDHEITYFKQHVLSYETVNEEA